MKFYKSLIQIMALAAILFADNSNIFISVNIDISTMPNLEKPGYVIKISPDTIRVYEKQSLLLNKGTDLLLIKSTFTSDTIIDKIKSLKVLFNQYGKKHDYRTGVDGMLIEVDIDGLNFNCQNCLDYKIVEELLNQKVNISKKERIKREAFMSVINDLLQTINISYKKN